LLNKPQINTHYALSQVGTNSWRNILPPPAGKKTKDTGQTQHSTGPFFQHVTYTWKHLQSVLSITYIILALYHKRCSKWHSSACRQTSHIIIIFRNTPQSTPQLKHIHTSSLKNSIMHRTRATAEMKFIATIRTAMLW